MLILRHAGESLNTAGIVRDARFALTIDPTGLGRESWLSADRIAPRTSCHRESPASEQRPRPSVAWWPQNRPNSKPLPA
jgi:hypothetical protein